MNDKLTVPKTIKVGFQKRSDTYTGKLAYVVYLDNKGVLRKEKSWQGWRDENISPEEYPNEPTAGFVLNKDVGGSHRSWSWNARREKVRVYDPRNFEFEISVENLLFILQECSSIKGKGLEGEFVYAWSGPEIVLMPVSSQEYKGSVEFTNLQTERVPAKDIKEGFSYLTKNQEEVMYLGKFPWWSNIGIYSSKACKGEKKHIFVLLNPKAHTDDDDKDDYEVSEHSYLVKSGFADIAKRTSESPLPQFADEFDKLNKSHFVSKPVKAYLSTEKLPPPKDDYDWKWGRGVGVEKDGVIFTGHCSKNYYDKGFFELQCDSRIEIKDGSIIFNRPTGSSFYWRSDQVKGFTKNGFYNNKMTQEEFDAIARKVVIEHENGSTSSID